MKSKTFVANSGRAFVLILDQGEEALKAITDFANKQMILGASVSAIGAFATARLGWFDLSARGYKPIVVGEQCEVLSLIGDIARVTMAVRAFIFMLRSACGTVRCAVVTSCPARCGRHWK